MVSLEKKLQLARRIREENELNQNALRGREAFLYGKTPYVSLNDPNAGNEAERPGVSTFRLRMTAAVILFGIFYGLATRGRTLLGVDSKQVYEAVETDYSPILFDFIGQIPYTLHQKETGGQAAATR